MTSTTEELFTVRPVAELVAVSGTASPHRAPAEPERAGARLLPLALATLFAVLYSILSLRRFASWDTPSFDNAIFEQAIKAYSQLRAPIVDIKGVGFNILGDHFSPITALLAPVYRLFPHAETLLVAQAVLVAISIVPVCRSAIRLLGRGAGTSIAIAYGLSFGVQSAIDVDFHEVAFAAVLVAFAGEAFLRGRWTAVVWWLLPLLLVKEDLGITVATAGVVLLLSGARLHGALLIVSGATGFVVTVFLLIPAFNPAGSFAYWSAVGFSEDGPSVFETFATGWDVKSVTVLLTVGVSGFLALRSPWLLLAVPTLAWRFLEVRNTYWGTTWHYSLILMPIVFIALVDGAVRARAGRPAWLRAYAHHVPAVAVAVALVLTPQFPMGKLLQAQTCRAVERTDSAERALRAMTPGTTVETNLDMVTHLVSDFHVHWIGADIIPDYVAVGNSDPGYDVAADAGQRHPGTRWVTVFANGGYFVAERIDG